MSDQSGPASELKPRIIHIDVEGTIATAKGELDNWTGHWFTDMFPLLKSDDVEDHQQGLLSASGSLKAGENHGNDTCGGTVGRPCPLRGLRGRAALNGMHIHENMNAEELAIDKV